MLMLLSLLLLLLLIRNSGKGGYDAAALTSAHLWMCVQLIGAREPLAAAAAAISSSSSFFPSEQINFMHY
jgi:hypothetical protein